MVTVLRKSIPSIPASITLIYSFSYGLLTQCTVMMNRIIRQSINYKNGPITIFSICIVILTNINEDGVKRAKNTVKTNGIRLKISQAVNQ